MNLGIMSANLLFWLGAHARRGRVSVAWTTLDDGSLLVEIREISDGQDKLLTAGRVYPTDTTGQAPRS